MSPILRSLHRRGAAMVAGAVFLVAAGTGSPAESPRIFALTGGKVVTAPGTTVEGGTVVIRDGLIESAGADVDVPADAWRIDVAGSWVFPGLIDADTALGLRGETSGSADADRQASMAERMARAARRSTPPGASHPIARIHPERRATDRLVPFRDDGTTEAERYREAGITVALAAPDDGILRGTSVAILLKDDASVPEMILADGVAQHAALERGRFGEGYPTSLMGAAAAFRQALLDARRYHEWSLRYRDDPRGMRRPVYVAAYEALGPVLGGGQPVFFSVDDPYDVLLADRLCREFRLEAVVSAPTHVWEIADRVGATGRPLILPITQPKRPEVAEDHEALEVSLQDMRRYLEAFRAPAMLHDAGVTFALTTRGLPGMSSFRRNMEKIVEAGLDEDVALAAWTTVPAAMLGLDDVLGTLEPGKIANVVVADGPPFAKDTRVSRVFVDGIEYRSKEKAKPKGDPDAVVDPRGTWAVVFEFGGRSVERTWVIEGEEGRYRGTAETRAGIVSFERIALRGNAMTVLFPARGDAPAFELTVIIEEDRFEGVAEMGSRTFPVTAVRTRGPEGGGR